MSDDADFIANYKNNHLYVNPGKDGAYAVIAGESEEVIGEIDVTSRCKLAVSAFYVNDRRDFSTFKITKLQYMHDMVGRERPYPRQQISAGADKGVSVHRLDPRSQRRAEDTSLPGQYPCRCSGSSPEQHEGRDLIGELASTPELHQDIYAVAAKRAALTEFKENLVGEGVSEPDWQEFFERNPWIFGHGLNYVFLDKVGKKLEARTTGEHL